MDSTPKYMNSSRQFPSCNIDDEGSPQKLSEYEDENEDHLRFKSDLEQFKTIIKRWKEKNQNHTLKVTYSNKDEERFDRAINLEIQFQKYSLRVRINDFHLHYKEEDYDNDDYMPQYNNKVEITNVDDINNSDIDQIELDLSKSWEKQVEQSDRNSDKFIILFLDEQDERSKLTLAGTNQINSYCQQNRTFYLGYYKKLKGKIHKVMNQVENKQPYFQKNFVPYPGGAAISWNSQGHLAVIKNLKMRQIIQQDPTLKMLDQTQKKMSRFNYYLTRERQNTKNQASLRLNKDFLLADSEENDENVFMHNFVALEDDENIDNRDYLNFKFDNFHFFPDVMQICTFFADHKKNMVMTSQTTQDPKKEENNLMNRRREKIVLNSGDIFAEKLKKLLVNSQNKRRDNNDDGFSSIYIFDFEKRQLMEENKLLEFLNKMIEFGKKNINSDAKYIQFIIQQILHDSTDETINIVKNIQKVLENQEFDHIESISYIGNFLLKNYFNELIESHKEKFLILAFQALIFENFISFVRIKNYIQNVAGQLAQSKFIGTDQFERITNMCKNLKFDRFSFTPFCLLLSHFQFFQSINIFNLDTTISQEFEIINKRNVIPKTNSKFQHGQVNYTSQYLKEYLTKYQLIKQTLNFEKIEPYDILQTEHRAQFLCQYIHISRNLNRRMLFIKERFLEKQIKLNFSVRRLIILLNSLFKSLCEGQISFINEFVHSCTDYERTKDEQQDQECSVCELKVKKSSIIICKSCKHGGHKDHIREWFKKSSRVNLPQQTDNPVSHRKKDDLSMSIFRWQSTAKQKYQQKNQQNQDMNETSQDQQSGELSAKNSIVQKQSLKLNILSEYFDREKSTQKFQMYQQQLSQIIKEIPFKAKYFINDLASQVLRDNLSLDKSNVENPNLFTNIFQFLSNLSLCLMFKELVLAKIVNLWFNKIPTLNPYSSKKLMWDSWITCLSSIVLFIYSLRIVFQQNKIGSIFDVYQSVIIPSSFVFWVIDVFFELNTGMLDKGELIVDKKYIQLYYLKRRFLLDAIGLVPIFYYLLYPKSDGISVDFLILFKIKHFSQTLDRLEYYLSYQQDKKNLVDLLKLVLLILVTTHLIALLWYRLAIFEKEILGYQETWLDLLKIKAITFMDFYFQALYFAVVTVYTVGYGDISPVTILECIFVTFTILITGIIFAYAINQIGLIMQNMNSSQAILKEDLMVLNKFMKQKNVSQDLRMRIRNYLEHTHRECLEINSEKQKKVINKISPSLIKEMNEDIYKEFIFDNQLFNNLFSKEFLKSTMDIVEEFVATPGEYLFKEGENDDQSIYFVFEGKVKIELNQQVISIITGGKFDEIDIIRQQQVIKNELKPRGLESQDYQISEGHSIFTNMLKNQPSQKKIQKSQKMTNILMERNKKKTNQISEGFFDLNKLAEEQTEKQQSKRQNIKDVTMNMISKLQNQQKCFGEYNFFCFEKERLYTAQVQEFSRIYRLKRTDFLDKIKDFKMDFEKFKEIQDEIMMFRHSVNFNAQCVVCGSKAHQHSQCHTIHFIPNQWGLIQMHNFTFCQERVYLLRKGFKRMKPTLNLQNLELEATKIQDMLKNEIDSFLLNICGEEQISTLSEEQQGDQISSQGNENNKSADDGAREENIIEEEGGDNKVYQHLNNNNSKEFCCSPIANETLNEINSPDWQQQQHQKSSTMKFNTKSIMSRTQEMPSANRMSQALFLPEDLQMENKLNQIVNDVISQKSQLFYDVSAGQSSLSSQEKRNIGKGQKWVSRRSLVKLNSGKAEEVIRAHQAPNVSNFIASQKRESEHLPPRLFAHSDQEPAMKHTFEENINTTTEDYMRYATDLMSKQFSKLSNQSNEKQVPHSFQGQKENGAYKLARQKERLLFEAIKDRKRAQTQEEQGNHMKQQTNLLRQVTEQIVKTLATIKYSQNQPERDDATSQFMMHNLQQSYTIANQFDNNKNFSDIFEKMKEYIYYFSHNNYSNVILQYNSNQDKRIAVFLSKKLKVYKKRRNLPLDKINGQQGMMSKQGSILTSKKYQFTQKGSDDNSLLSNLSGQIGKQQTNYPTIY